MSDIQNKNYLNKINHVANTELMQFTLGKTEKTINNINIELEEWIKYIDINDDATPDKIIIPVIFTNNSLAETEQWEIRLNNSFNTLKIRTVSSKSTADYSGANDLISYMKECDIKSLPNIIVMCMNGTRINTCMQLLEAFSHKSPSPRNDIIIQFDTYFDEIDSHIFYIILY